MTSNEMQRWHRAARMALASAVLGAAAACGFGNNGDTMPGAERAMPQPGADPNAVASGTQARSDDQLASQAQALGAQDSLAPAPVSDDAIIAMLASTSKAEIDNGRIAVSRSRNASVRAYANDMVTAHTAMQQQGRQAASQLDVAVTAVPNDTVQGTAAAAQTTLSSISPGPEFDRAYLASQVRNHEATLGTLRQAQSRAQHESVRALVRDAIPMIEAHLQRARDLQGTVGGGR